MVESQPADGGPDDISREVREALERGEYAPGQRLVESELAATYGVSRSAVRTALRQLANDGLVDVERHKGARIRKITLAEAIEITEVRRAIEAIVAGRAAERATPAEVEALKSLETEMHEAIEENDFLRYSELNRRLHLMIRTISRQGAATGLLDKLQSQLVRLQFRLAMRPGRPRVSLKQHSEIIQAITEGDAQRAEAVMYEHLTSVLETLYEMQGHDPNRGV